ncbi:MAG: hypothetical protein P8O16_12685 [Algoriphagus sp.]|uniref:hypothetical protein n=1 Tax=Algoriphagus sp. TaxID=1872435 RepID=UPI00260A2C8E|nr:hypothetical protein [Algoriphagus sp.]MDG1278131.1 hypothetical protein [Algoriphagus sp.]
MDGYAGIWDSDRSWMVHEHSQPVRVTLFCYLISQGKLYVEGQKLKSFDDGNDDLIQFIEGYFGNKCIVNFTDLFFLDEINQAFCGGSWHKVQECWLVGRSDYMDIVESRKPKYIVEEKVYIIHIFDFLDSTEGYYFLRRHKYYTTVLELYNGLIEWKSRSYTSRQFIRDYSINPEAKLTYKEITLDEFQSRFFDVVELEVGSLLN